MRHDRLLILGGFLMSAMFAVGCGSSSPNNGVGGKGAGGSTGAGGKGTGGSNMDAATEHGAGGSVADAGMDHGSTAETGADTSGAGGSSPDAHGDVAADLAMDMAMDTPVDAGHDAGGPCVTDYGAGNKVLFNFNGGVNSGWYTYVKDDGSTGLTTSLGASFTEGRKCVDSLILATNFTSYSLMHTSGFLETFFGTSPAGANWTGYKALHAWIKLEGADLPELNGVYFYIKSGAQAYYQSAYAASSSLTDWFEVVIDLTRAPNTANGSGVAINDIQLMGFEALLNTAPGLNEPATPSQLLLLADDIWLEAAPPSDAGADTGSATDAGGQ